MCSMIQASKKRTFAVIKIPNREPSVNTNNDFDVLRILVLPQCSRTYRYLGISYKSPRVCTN